MGRPIDRLEAELKPQYEKKSDFWNDYFKARDEFWNEN